MILLLIQYVRHCDSRAYCRLVSPAEWGEIDTRLEASNTVTPTIWFYKLLPIAQQEAIICHVCIRGLLRTRKADVKHIGLSVVIHPIPRGRKIDQKKVLPARVIGLAYGLGLVP